MSEKHKRRLFILYILFLSVSTGCSQNTFYYNKYKHWNPELEALASEGNDAMAIVSLGSCYDRADGIGRNTNKAFNLFKSAAQLGDFLALYNLGYYHFKGISTDANYYEAEKYLLACVKKIRVSCQLIKY